MSNRLPRPKTVTNALEQQSFKLNNKFVWRRVHNMSNIPTICDVGELLILLRDNLPARAVAYVGDDLAVCDCANGNPARPIACEQLATIRFVLHRELVALVSREAGGLLCREGQCRSEAGICLRTSGGRRFDHSFGRFCT
jgi:hypothetical protein